MFSEKNKKCNGCKKNIDISSFILDIKEYARCNECRKQATNKYKKNICEICGIGAYFNIPELTWGRFCKEHSQLGMVNVKSKRCLNEDCNKIPYFNYENEKTPRYCKSCMLPGMIDIVNQSKLCGCDKKVRATFNLPGEKKAICCSNCKTELMVNVIDVKCQCGKSQPTFNVPNSKKAICCQSCKTPDMIDFKNIVKLCVTCKKFRANYNIESEFILKYLDINKFILNYFKIYDVPTDFINPILDYIFKT